MGERTMTAAEFAAELLARLGELQEAARRAHRRGVASAFGSWAAARAQEVVLAEMARKAEISEKRRAAGRLGGKANAKQTGSKSEANGKQNGSKTEAKGKQNPVLLSEGAAKDGGSPRAPLTRLAGGGAGAGAGGGAHGGARRAGAGAAEVVSSPPDCNHSFMQAGGVGGLERLREYGTGVLAGSGLAWEEVALSAEVAGFGAAMLKNWLDQHAKNGWRVAGGKGPKLTKYDLTKNMGAWVNGQRGRDAGVEAAAKARAEGAGKGRGKRPRVYVTAAGVVGAEGGTEAAQAKR